MASIREVCDQSVAVMQSFFKKRSPALFIQTGTGITLSDFFDSAPEEMPLDNLPTMPEAHSPAGHTMRLLLGESGGVCVLLCEGRRHYYEGYGMNPCILPTCTAIKCGIENIVQIAACGGVNEDLKPGDIVVITDYINNLSTSPLIGNQDLLDNPFPDMRNAFSQKLNSMFINAAYEVNIHPSLGIHQANTGPQFETPAEVELFRKNGVDTVGMSIVPEIIAASALGASAMGIALIANPAAGHHSKAVDHNFILQVCNDAGDNLSRALKEFCKEFRYTEGTTSAGSARK